jgi:hypothetical protein
MKDLKLKDLVLEQYRKVYETKMDGLTVRVWKPKTMGKLPTYAMLDMLKSRAYDASRWAAIERNRKVQWWLGNPDYGVWDAQIVRRFNPRQMTLDIYFAALLIRPFSRQAHEWYEAHSLPTDPVARLTLMWDSREFDRDGCYDTNFGAYKNQKDVDKYIYSGEDVEPFDCITDPKFDVCFSQGEDDIQRRCVKFKYEDGEIHYEAVQAADEEKLRGGTKMMHECAKVFCDFRKEHPEVVEMDFYTDDEVMMLE